MATVTGKRKRQDVSRKASPAKKAASVKSSTQAHIDSNRHHSSLDPAASKLAIAPSINGSKHDTDVVHLQIVTGSYERVLHGLCAAIPSSALVLQNAVELETAKDAPVVPAADIPFSDNFLFAAHASAIRCLAVSPPTEDSDKRYLASGSSDERINVYSLSTAPPPQNTEKPTLPSLTGTSTAENPRNRSLGSLIHHDRAITKLHFATKSKLFSAAEDSTIAISRTRDWTVLSSIKAPIPKPQGRPSGDTAGPGEIPAGINDFAIHPSQKLMISVGRGEKSMRLWNLMTGKKAGVLTFDRDVLSQVGEGKFSSGEGRRIIWDETGENFIVGFERGAVIFNIETKPQAIIKPSPPSKVHQMSYLNILSKQANLLALSTEDGRILFFNTAVASPGDDSKLPVSAQVAQIGGRQAGVTGRIKDFEIVLLPAIANSPASWILITGHSDGAVRLWTLFEEEITRCLREGSSSRQIGHLLATHETGDRITCLTAFILDGTVSNATIQDEIEGNGVEEEASSSEDSES